MSEYHRRPPRSRPRNRLLGPALTLLGVLVAFVVGLALGRALEEGPAPGGTRTSVRTLEPQPLPPAAKTVTVTVTTGG
jgi:hypothetical protein